MCGILGSNFLDEQKILELSRLLSHRGPDQDGHYRHENVCLAHKRLSIIDLSERGKQPMADDSGRFIITYNGEIYNYREIRDELQKLGHTFFSESDTEVIIKSYRQWQAGCLAKFDGQFAFCIYDNQAKTFFLARDRMGVKPLYYYCKGGRFLFASETKVFLHEGISRTINDHALNSYLIFGYTPTGQTMVNDVQKLLPGEYLIVDCVSGTILEKTKYWKISFTPSNLDDHAIEHELFSKIERSVKSRLMADVPVGAFLSGGIDSSIIVYFMRKYVKQLKTFSIAFDYSEYNESSWSKMIAKKFDTDHYEVMFTAQDVKTYLPQITYAFDDPLGDPALIPTYLVSKVAREHVTVCLLGTGGDELFGGYARHREFLILRQLNKLPLWSKNILGLAYSLYNRDRGAKLNQLLRGSSSEATLYLKLFSFLFRSEKELNYSLSELDYLQGYFSYPDPLTNMLNFDQHEYLINGLLHKEDRATLAVSLEGRVPFVEDHNLLEFANSIPSYSKLRFRNGKLILKNIFRGHLPDEVLDRRKMGFGVPLEHYFRNELKEYVREIIFDFNGFEYYDKATIMKLWEQHQSKASDYSNLFFVIMMFNLWHDRWLSNRNI